MVAEKEEVPETFISTCASVQLHILAQPWGMSLCPMGMVGLFVNTQHPVHHRLMKQTV